MNAAVVKFPQLAKVQGDSRAQLTALKQSIDFEFGLPGMFIDLAGASAGRMFASKSHEGAGVRLFSANEPRFVTDEGVKAYLQRKWATPGDNPILEDIAARTTSWFHTNMPEIDLGWTNLFQTVDLRGSNQDSFEIIDTNAGIAYEQYKPGAKIKIRREFSEAKATVKYLTCGDGIGILDDWLRFQRFWNIEQVTAESRAKAWDKQAELHYGLFTALGAGINQTFDTDDTKTFNAAAAKVLRDVHAQGYGTGQNASFWILCAPEHVGRILKMLEVRSGSAILANQANKEPLAYNVAGVIASTYVPANSTGYYLVLPGRKIQRGVWKDLTVESERDIYSRAQDWVFHMQFNAAIGNSAQVRRVLFA